MSLPPDDDDDWGGSWGVPVDEELPPPPRPPEPAPPTPAAGHGFGSWQSSATKEKKKGKKGAAAVKKPQYQETLKMVPTTMVLPPFPEMRRTRAFDDSKGNGLHLIEISEGIAKGTMVTEDSVRDYIAHDFHANRSPRSAVSEESTKLFYSVQQSDSRRHLTPLPISENLFDSVAPYARIPSNYIDILSRPIAMQVFAKPRTPKTSAHAKSDAQKEYLSFIIRSAAKGVNGLIFGATFTYHFPTRYMYAFIHIYEMPPYIDVIPSLASSLSSPNSTPFLIPLFLLHVDTEQRYKFITNAHATLFSLEIQAGVRESSHDTEGTDFSALSKDLSYFIGNLSLVDWACKTMTRQLEFIGEVKKKYRTQATLSGIKGEEIENTMCVMEEGLHSLGCLNKSIQEQTECLSQRAQALIQTVYSGIAQRDAALSQLAANAAARDSAIMRVIAAITMFFLPATTVATFFSTSFFDFQVTRHEQVYSWWLWLYWVTTVCLTVAVMAATFWWWRKKERELYTAQMFDDGSAISKVRLRERVSRRVMRFRGLRRNMIEDMSDDGR